MLKGQSHWDSKTLVCVHVCACICVCLISRFLVITLTRNYKNCWPCALWEPSVLVTDWLLTGWCGYFGIWFLELLMISIRVWWSCSHLQAVVALCWLLTLLCRKLQTVCTGTRQSALGIVPGPCESLPRAGSGKVPPVFPWLSRLNSQGLLPRLSWFNARSEGSGLVFLLWISSFLCCFFSTVFLTHLSKTGWLSSSFAGVLFHWWAGVFCTRTVLGSPVAVWCDTSSGTKILRYLSIALCRSLCVRICIRIAFLVPFC